VLCGVVATAAAEAPNGAELYGAYCASCHGADGRGDGPEAEAFAPPPRNLHDDALSRESVDALVERIRHGRPLLHARDLGVLRGRSDDTELLVAHLRRLPRLKWRLIDRGEEIYVDRCEICHGPFGRAPAALPSGVTKPPRDLSDAGYQRSTSDAELLDEVRHGHAAMPAIPGLDVTANQDALVAFLRLLSPGYERYSRFCAGCHGEDGRGPGGDWASAPRPTVVFDERYLAAKDPEVLRKAIWHMLESAAPQMPHMSRVLTPTQVRAIVAHLRSSPASPR
jgi:mono/diheme cytochrome c family protein